MAWVCEHRRRARIGGHIGNELGSQHQLVQTRPLGFGDLKHQHCASTLGQPNSQSNGRLAHPGRHGTEALVAQALEQVGGQRVMPPGQAGLGSLPLAQHLPAIGSGPQAERRLSAAQERRAARKLCPELLILSMTPQFMEAGKQRLGVHAPARGLS